MADNNYNNNNSQATEEKKKSFKIRVKDPIDFEATTQTMFVESNELCKTINSLFAPIFKDYVGCVIQMNSAGANGNFNGIQMMPNPDGVIADVPLNAYYVTLIFKDRGDASSNEIKNLRNLHDIKGANNNAPQLANRYMAYAGSAARSRNYDVTDETKEALEDFMWKSYNQKLGKGFWDKHIVEYAEYMSAGLYDQKPISHVKIMGLSLDRLVSAIYGMKDDEGNDVEYMVTPTNVPPVLNVQTNLIFQINRLSVKNFKELTSKLYSGTPLASTFVPYRA